MSRNVNIILQLLNLVVAGILHFGEVIPAQYQTLAAIVSFAIAGVIGVIASNYNPDGTPAVKPYTPELPKRDNSTFRMLVVPLLVLGLLTLTACPWGGKDDSGKVSDIVQVARIAATTNVALGAMGDITDILTQDSTVSQDKAQTVFKASERALRLLDRARDTINAGTWDTRELYTLLDNALAEVARLEADIGIKNPESAARFRAYIALARYGIQSAAQIIKNLKPPTPPDQSLIESDSKRPRVESLTADQLTQIIGVSTVASLKVIEIRTANAETAWRIAADESKTIHAANSRRIK